MSDHFSQPGTPRTEIYQELAQLRLIDPHTHINPHSPASTTLADLLGYHYYTELARSAGMPKVEIEDPSIGPKELVERLVGGLAPIENTIQYSWLISICRMFFGFDEEKLHLNNWEDVYDRSESIMSSAQWPDMVLDQSNVEAVFLTNDFDDDLAGFDSDRYIPCLRTDDLVFNLADPNVRGRLAACTEIELDGTLSSLRASLRQRFEHFVSRGARACAISLPPSFTPTPVPDGRASTALNAVLKNGMLSQPNDKDALARRVFWTLAELCDEFGLPFDLMIGVNRKVYPDGVYQGQDLYDSRVSLIQYKDLFNAFPDVKFPVSVLASVTNQELVSYAWIFPNVYPNGHWWYSNTPSTITHDLAARLEAVPQTKMIGYYSDAYKLEFVWPKFDMYRKVLAGVLADQFVGDRGWSVERAVELGRQVLKDNTEEIFPRPAAQPTPVAGIPDDAIDVEMLEVDDVEMLDDPDGTRESDNLGSISTAAAATAATATAAVGAAAMDFFDDEDEEAVLEVEELEAEELQVEKLEVEEFELDDADEDSTREIESPLGVADESDSDGNGLDVSFDPEEPLELEQALELTEVVESSEPSDLSEPAGLAEAAQQALEVEQADSPKEELAGEESFLIEEPESNETSDTYDTILIEPQEEDPAATTPVTPSNADDSSSDDSLHAEGDDENLDDLGNPLSDTTEITKLGLVDDSAGTVVESPLAPRTANVESLLDASEDDVPMSFETQIIEASPLAGRVSEEVAELVADGKEDVVEAVTDAKEAVVDKVEEVADEVAEIEDDAVEFLDELVDEDPADNAEEDAEEDPMQTIAIDPIPEDDEIGELDLDDVELMDPSGARVLASDAVSAELDDEPLDVGNLLSDDDADSDVADFVGDVAEDDEDVAEDMERTMEVETPPSGPKIQQLRGETSFSPDEDSLKLKPDPLTGEFTFNLGDDDGDEIQLSPPPEPSASTPKDDDDEFDLEWLSEDDDKDN